MKDRLVGTYPVTTATTVELFEHNLNSGKLESFTFDKQNRFGFIEIISRYVEKNILPFSDIWPFLGTYTLNDA